MNTGELFTRAVEMLPDAVRERLDGDAPLDWAALESLATGEEVARAAAAHQRLPRAVEALAHRLIRDVGIVPADVVAAVERQGAASAWIHWVTLEADGEGYQIRNDRNGDVHTGVRPEAIAGYATLALELATMVHEAAERWIEAGERHEVTAEDERSRLARCAVRMSEQIRSQPETISGLPTTASSARTLEYAWNSQSTEARTALAGARLSTSRGARAPRRSYYAAAVNCRLRACDAGEIRWLRALAERAAMEDRSGAGIRSKPPEPDRTRQETAFQEEAGAAAGPVIEAPPEPPGAGQLVLGSEPEGLLPDDEVGETERAANYLPGAVRRRLGEAYGTGFSHALVRFQSREDVDRLRTDLRSAAAGQRTAPWLEELARTLLADTGAQTREGLRTGSLRLGADLDGALGYRVTEVASDQSGHLTPIGLVEQIRLGLGFSKEAWSGLTALESAGKEGHWTLNEAESGGRTLKSSEREMLEAAAEIGRALERISSDYADAHGKRSPSALEEAAMTAGALRSVGPTVRTAAGWPGVAEAPDPRNPDDIARIAAVAETLNGQIRGIANRLIAGWIAEAQAFGERRRG